MQATKPAATAAKKPAAAAAAKPTAAAAAKPPPKYHMGAEYPYAFTDEYSEKKTHRIDLVVYLPGHVKSG